MKKNCKFRREVVLKATIPQTMQRKQFFKGKYKGKIKSSQKRPTIPWTPRECGTGKTNRSKQSQDNKINEVKLNAKHREQKTAKIK